jgi:hypothetical protein
MKTALVVAALLLAAPLAMPVAAAEPCLGDLQCVPSYVRTALRVAGARACTVLSCPTPYDCGEGFLGCVAVAFESLWRRLA